MSGLELACLSLFFFFFSPTSLAYLQRLEIDNHFQLMFNRFRPAHACNAHLSWMNNAGTPTERCSSLAHMPKHPFTRTTKKSGFFCHVFQLFFPPLPLSLFWQAYPFPDTLLIKLRHTHTKLKSTESWCVGVYISLWTKGIDLIWVLDYS